MNFVDMVVLVEMFKLSELALPDTVTELETPKRQVLTWKGKHSIGDVNRMTELLEGWPAADWSRSRRLGKDTVVITLEKKAVK